MDNLRQASVTRKTKETKIELELLLEGSGKSEIQTGCGFLNHMLTLLIFHSGFDLSLTCRGDLEVDAHHTTEDVGFALGTALHKALADRTGIRRYGQALLPMDETLVLAALDLSGRNGCYLSLQIPSPRIGTFDTELVNEFFQGLCRGGFFTLHLQQLAGKNSHHICEACFKGVGRAMREAVSQTGNDRQIPSSKGLL